MSQAPINSSEAAVSSSASARPGWRRIRHVLPLCGLAIVVGILAAMLGLGAAVAGCRRSARLRRRVPSMTALAKRRAGFMSRLLLAAGDVGRQASQVRLARRDAVAAAGLFGASWLSDAVCLACALLAVGATPPWLSVLMAYAAAQLVTFLPITPGGLGLVEGSLLLALATGRTDAGGILAGVLLYRGLSYWATLPGGLLGYLNLRRAGGRRPLLPVIAIPAESPAPS